MAEIELAPTLDTSAAEALLTEASALLERVANDDPRQLVSFAITEISVALESLSMRRRFESLPLKPRRRR